jgi:hypothetical protein
MQKKIIQDNKNDEPEVAFSSNSIRLSAYEWFVVAIVALALIWFGPSAWKRIEKFQPVENYRIPYELSNDYWLFERYCRYASRNYDVLVIGDSVIWGHYVSQNQTLSGYLNEMASRSRFANMGVDGIHPAALAGLLKYYGRDITNKKVIIQFNPLWISSEKYDLSTDKEYIFNHPRLVPQFYPKIPCYNASYQRRISAVLERYVPTFGWISHLQIANLQNMSIAAWTLEHPYGNPLDVFNFSHTSEADKNPPGHIIQTGATTAKQDIAWVTPDDSIQWRFFRQSVELLRKRGNDVLVIVGPFNEHILSENSDGMYSNIKNQVELWLKQNHFDYYIPPVLPENLYADVSHPVGEGYAMLAQQLLQTGFIKSINNSR